MFMYRCILIIQTRNTVSKEEDMKRIVIAKETVSNGYKTLDCYLFRRTISGDTPCMDHYMKNYSGTYFRRINTVFFETAEDGNRKFNELKEKGYKVIDRYYS